MATINATKGGTVGLPYGRRAGCFPIRNTVDFSKIPAAASDVVQALNVPAGVLVLNSGYRVKTPEGGTAGGTLGDGADVDGFLATANLNAAAGTVSISQLALAEGTPNTVVGYSGGKFYAAADTIDFIPANALDAAVVEFFAVCIDLS